MGEPTDAPLSILVQNLSGLGNALLATPLLAELRRLYPRARIDVLTTPAAALLLANNPHATEIIPDPYAGRRRTRDYWLLTAQLRQRAYDACLVTLTAVDFPFAVRPVLARIGTRVIHDYAFGFTGRHTELFTHRVPFDQTRHDVESNLDLLRALTSAEVRGRRLVLPVSEEARAEAGRCLRDAGWSGGRPTVALCPGSTRSRTDKRWPAERYVALARELLADYRDLSILFFCGPDEVEDVRVFRQALPDPRVTVVTELGLPAYAAALSLCDAAVSGDSLPVHLCAALQVPLVALFGPTDPRRTGPWMSPAKVLVPDCDWIPYYRMPYPPPPDSFEPCMPRLPVSAVHEALGELLAEAREREDDASHAG